MGIIPYWELQSLMMSMSLFGPKGFIAIQDDLAGN
jgi:hypothetical protein